MIPEALNKIYIVALKHDADISSVLTQDGVGIFGTAEGASDGYGIAVSEVRKFAAVLSENTQNIIEDEITEDWFAVQIRRALLSPIGMRGNYASNISGPFGFPSKIISIDLDGYICKYEAKR